MMRKALILQFGPLEFDGRTQRVAEVVSEKFEILILDQGDREPLEGTFPWRVLRKKRKNNKYINHLKVILDVFRTTWKEKPNYLIAENYFMLPSGWLAGKCLGVPLLYDAHELNIKDKAIPQTFRDKVWYAFEAMFIQAAKVVVAANVERARLMKAYYKLPSAPFSFTNIPNPLGRKSDPYMAEVQKLSALKAVGRKLLLYQGDMSFERGLERFISAMKFLPDGYLLVLVGSGPDTENISSMVVAEGLSGKVLQLPRVESRKLFNITSLCHLGIVTYSDLGLNNHFCSPNKIYEYAQAGIPVVATNQPPLKRMLRKHPIGRLIEPRLTPREIAECLVGVCENRESYSISIPGFLEEYDFFRERTHFQDALTALALDRQ